MFSQSILAPWTRLFTSLALEVILVFALTALLARLVRSASGQRMVWRLSFVALTTLLLAEFSGVGHSIFQHRRQPPPASVPPRTFVVTTSVPDDRFPASARAPAVADVPVGPPVNSQEKLLSTLARWLPVLALAGLVWVGVRRCFGALRLIRLGRRAPSDSGDLAARVRALGRRLGIRRHVRVKLIEGLFSPIAFGIVRPTVGVPKDFSARFTAAQQEAMLAHELAHVAAFDAAWMLLADLVTALLWWHPGAWWARRHLRAASETAADEASLLLDDGPATLAECLVTLGDLLTRSPDPGGLGMAGFRFRSELGRRVERLLHLRGPSRHPWCGAGAWLARLLVPAALLTLALAFTAWLLPPAAHAGTFGETFQRSPLGLAATALLTADKHQSPRLIYRGKQLQDVEQPDEAEANDAPGLLLQGKKLYDAGKTNEAEAKWRTALELDPSNKVALDYLANFNRTNLPAAKPAVQPSAPTKMKDKVPVLGDLPFVGKQFRSGTNLVSTSNARQKIYQKLSTIRLTSVKFVDLPLQQVVEVISKEVKNRDPEKQGVNFVINTTAVPQANSVPRIDPATGLPTAGAQTSGVPTIDPATGLPTTKAQASAAPEIDPATGLPATSTAKVEGDIGAVTIRVDPPLHDVTLHQVLDIIVKVADRPLKYSIEDYGVLISLRTATDSPPLHTRWFKIDPNTFMRGIQEVVPLQYDSATMRRLRSRDQSATNDIAAEIVGELIRLYFQNAGVVLDPPKSLIFTERKGMLLVRASLQDLDIIEQLIAVLNTTRPQVHIEVKFCEVPEELLAAPGLKLQPTTVTNGAGTNVALTTLTSVLTPEQFRNVLRALEQKKDVTFLAAPSVITPSGRQAQLKTVKVQSIVTGLDLSTNAPAEPGKLPEHPLISEQFEFGPVVDIIPSVAADRRTISMRVIAGLKEFAGYVSGENDYWDYVESEGANPAPPRPPPKPPRPIFRERQAMSSATLWDGQTFVLASREVTFKTAKAISLIELPKELAKDLVRRRLGTKGSETKALLVFVTPMIVDPAGNAIHTDADLPARTNSVPSLLPPSFK